MSSTMEELTVVLRADDRRFRRQMQQAERTTTRQLQRMGATGTRTGTQAGQGFAGGMTRATTQGMATVSSTVQRSLATTQAVAARTGTQAGQGFARGLSASIAQGTQATTATVTRSLQASAAPAAQAGQRAGRSFTTGLAGGLAGARAQVATAMGSMRTESAGVSGAVSRIGSSFKSMAGVAAGALGAIGITSFAQGVFETGASINEARASLTGMYGDADQARQMVSDINSEFRRSTVGVDVLQGLASNLAYMGFEGNEALGVIRNIDTAAGALPGNAGAAVESVSNALLTAQVQGNAFVGELNQISRVGFPVFDALEEHLGLATGQAKELASEGKIAFEDLMHVMTDPSMSQFWEMTDAAATATSQTFRQSFQGMVNSVQVSFAEMLDSGLNKLAPGMNRVADQVDEAMDALPATFARVRDAADQWGVTDALADVGRAARSLATAAVPLISGFATGVGAAFGATLVALRPVFRMLESIGDWMRENSEVVKTFGTVVGVAAGALGVFRSIVAGRRLIGGLTKLMGPVGWVITGISALASGLRYAWENSEVFRRIVGGAFNAISSAGTRLRNTFTSGVWPALVNGFGEIRDAATPAVRALAAGIRRIIDAVTDLEGRWGFIWSAVLERIQWFKDLGSQVLDTIKRQYAGWVDIIAGIFSRDWSRVWEGASEVTSAGFDLMTATGETGWKLFTSTLRLLFLDLPRAISSWMRENIPVIAAALADWWTESFLPWFRETRAKILAELGRWWRETYLPWLTSRPAAIASALADWWTESFLPWFTGLRERTRTSLNEWWNESFVPWLQSRPAAFAEALAEWWTEGLQPWLANRPEAISSEVDGWSDAFTEWASGLWDKVVTGFHDFGESFTEWMEDFADRLPEMIDTWTDNMVQRIEEFADELPEKIAAWTDRFVEWVEDFADDIPAMMEDLTDQFTEWASDAPEEMSKSFAEADGPGKIEEQIENDWGPRLIKAFIRAGWALIRSIPTVVDEIGKALLTSLGTVLVETEDTFTTSFGRLLDTAEQIWDDIKDAIVGKIRDMASDAKEAVGEMVGDTVDSFTGLFDTLVGNSIVPDMVDGIIDETGRLPGGVGSDMREMSTGAIASAVAMQTSMGSTMTTMGTRVREAMTQMSASGRSIMSGMVTSLVTSLTTLGSQSATALSNLRTNFVTSFSNMGTQVRSAFSGMVTSLTTLTSTLSTQLTSTISTMGRNVVSGFSSTVQGVSSAWSGIRSAVAAPVRYVISPVFNSGLVGVWNRVADKVPGLSPLNTMPTPNFATGGLVDLTNGGAMSGFSVQDNRLAMVRDGEGVLTPAATRGLGGSSFINAANQAGTGAGRLLAGVEGFDRGGIVGLVRSFGSAAKDYFRDGAVAAARSALNPMADMIGNEYGRGDTFPGGYGYRSAKHWIGSILTQVEEHKSHLEGGDGQAVVDEAKKHIGKTGRPNEFMTPYMGGSWPWCGAFVGTSFKRAGAYDALSAVDWKPLVSSYTTLPRTAAPMPGDLPLYRGDSGHINIVEDPAARTTIGGNESDGVRRQRGYMNSASSIRRPNFRTGGMIDFAKDFWGQDAAETNDILAPEDARMRDIFNGVQTYDQGGWLAPGYTLAYNNTGGPEPIGAEPIEIIIDLRGDDEDMVRRLRKAIKTKGGGNVQVALGTGRRG